MELQRLRQLSNEIRESHKTKEDMKYWVDVRIRYGMITKSEGGFLYVDLGIAKFNA